MIIKKNKTKVKQRKENKIDPFFYGLYKIQLKNTGII